MRGCYNVLSMALPSGRPWYADGLAFECVRCGRCCAGPEEGYVWVTREEIAAIAEFLGMAEDDFRNRYVRRVGWRHSLVERAGNKDCIFLTYDANGLSACAIYPVRPVQCRTWPFWPANLKSPAAWSLAAQRCPGINRGRKHAFDDIQQKRSRTRA